MLLFCKLGTRTHISVPGLCPGYYVCCQPVDITYQLFFPGVEIDLHLISLLLDNEHCDQVQFGIKCGQRNEQSLHRWRGGDLKVTLCNQ